ncbi:MAG: NUDIX hydrolase [Butyribacter sp.]|nr:NUDIX hydrolase [bacterium]MDY3853600.1 NUDIX hydrolase [Butyribacter sp.]
MNSNRYRILVKGIVQRGNEFLAVEKWYDDNIIDPYQWEFVDGEAEFGESPDAAVIRVVQEQTGLTAEVDRILYTWTFMIGSECNLGIAYLCLTDMEEDEVILSEELHDAKWIEPSQFDEYINNKRMLADLEKAEIY